MFLSTLWANETETDTDEENHVLKVNKDGIKVYIYRHKNSKFATFKATTHINASMGSILAVLFDAKSSPDWIHGCIDSFILKDISFNERYHYQIIYVPFPFDNRDFIFHSILKQDPTSKAITITTSSSAEYCKNNSSKECKKVKQSKLVRVNKSVGTYKLEEDITGTKITWIQHTDPEGNLPAWLVNQLIKDTPYWTFKLLAEKVKDEKYTFAKLVYNNQGRLIGLNIPTKQPAKELAAFPDF